MCTVCKRTNFHFMVIVISVKEGLKDSGRKKESRFPNRLLHLMKEMFGPQNVNWSLEDTGKIEIYVDSGHALLDPKTLTVETSDDSLQHLVSVAAKRLHVSLAASLT